jgi:hypothetical protein
MVVFALRIEQPTRSVFVPIPIGELFRQIVKDLQAQDSNPNSYLNNPKSDIKNPNYDINNSSSDINNKDSCINNA